MIEHWRLMTFAWRCRLCGVKGEVERVAPIEFANQWPAIRASHRAMSPECPSQQEIRVRVYEAKLKAMTAGGGR